MSVTDQVKERYAQLVELRRDFHAHPEVSLQEYRTATRIEEELDKLGITHVRCGETGVCGVLHGKKEGRGVIALRADIDALSIAETHETPYMSQNQGVMHACGHDSHTACLLGAAGILAAQTDNFGGEVRFFFQQAEEIGAGAKIFIEAGHLQGVERIFGLHVASDLEVGTVGIKTGPNNAAVDFFRIKITGKAAHVSAPQTGTDALFIASQIVVSAQALRTRLHSPIEPVLIGIGKLEAGTAYNIVAGEAVMEGTIRTMTKETRKNLKSELQALAEQMAAMYGGAAEIEWKDYTSPLINPGSVCDEVRQQAAEIPGLHIFSEREVSLGGDDFAEFQELVPGAYAYLGTRNSEKSCTALPLHNDGFDIEENALVYGTALYAQYALWWLTR